jgi:AcrR family transcriptional regulator
MGTKSSATRDRILQRGLELMSREGMSGVTIGQMAERVGMSKSGLFAHFRSKDEVQMGLLDHMARVAEAHVVGPAMAEPAGLPGWGR